MPVQAKVGLTIWILGLLLSFACAAFKLDASAAVIATTIASVGSGLFSKERWQQSEHAAKLYSKRPPGLDVTGIVVMLAITFGCLGCAGTQEAVDTVRRVNTQAEAEAAQLREKLQAAELQYAAVASLVPTICAWRGQNTVECATLEGLKRAIDESIPRAKAALSIAEQSTLTLAAALVAVDAVEVSARDFRADVERARERLHEALATLTTGPATPPPAAPPAEGGP